MNFLSLLEKLLFHCVKVGRFFGVAVRIHWSFWILPVGFGIAALPYGWLNAAVFVGLILLFFVCVVLHEFGHILAARTFGVKTRDVIVTPIGGVARMENMPDNPIEEIVIALAGPAVNVIIAGLLICAIIGGLASGRTFSSEVNPMHLKSWMDAALVLTIMNIGMVMLNMLPAFPSDGGRVLRAFLSMFIERLPATRIAVGLGTVVAIVLAVIGFTRGPIQLPVIAALFAFVGHMELRMIARQEQNKGRVYNESRRMTPARAFFLTAPEPGFSGYSWDADNAAWVEWRDGEPVRHCRTRGW